LRLADEDALSKPRRTVSIEALAAKPSRGAFPLSRSTLRWVVGSALIVGVGILAFVGRDYVSWALAELGLCGDSRSEAERSAGRVNRLGDKGKPGEAREGSAKGVEINARDGMLYNNAGCALADQGKHAEACEKFAKAVEIDPRLAIAYSNWGGALLKMGRNAEACEKLAKAVEIDPRLATAYSNWGVALDARGKAPEACEKYAKAVEVAPRFAEAYSNWGRALWNMGKPAEACEKYAKAVDINPRLAEGHCNWGIALAGMRKPAEACEKYAKAVEISPRYAEAHFNWGYALLVMGEPAEACEKFAKAVEIDPRCAKAYLGWGAALGLQGKTAETIEKLDKAATLDPSMKERVDGLRRVLKGGKGKPDEAREKSAKVAEANVGEAGPVTFPGFGPSRLIQPGITWQETTLRRGTLPMRVWYYQPEKVADKLPLVLVPPAGSNLFCGKHLSDGDRPEHYPYVRAGFAVASFDIDGHVNRPTASDEALLQGARAFRDARAGLANAKAALDFLLATVPNINPNRVFVAGHSSAATLALLVAEHEPRIKACAAYAPVTDVEARLAEAIPGLESLLPGYREFLRFSSPKTHVDRLKCPVFLFHAQDDGNAPMRHSTDFAALLNKTNRHVTLVTTPGGGHYDSMIREGIPKGIEWFQQMLKTGG